MAMAETVFKKVDYTLGGLLTDIRMGEIGLPDLQRPFVWKNAKVRDLFDSLYRGYPVGYLLFWQTSAEGGGKQIGVQEKQLSPNYLIVDGQQRLTALYAVTRGEKVVREDYSEEAIEISFCPLDGTFEVADAATRNDPRYLPSITPVFGDGASLFTLLGEYVGRLERAREQTGEPVTTEERKTAEHGIQRLAGLTGYPLTALVLDSSIDEEQVGEVFVRINSKGKTLNQSDFILTLMSVFWDDGRKALESFCKLAHSPPKNAPSPANVFIDPLPDQLLRVSVGIGFNRARLKHVYSLLRGRDLESGTVTSEQREKQFQVLRQAQEDVINLQHWHGFLSILPTAGYRTGRQVMSSMALLMAYILYLMGRRRFDVDPFELTQIIAQWFFMSSLTARYTGGSAESLMERDLVALREMETADEFLKWLRANLEVELTPDYWSISLPNRLKTSAARSPALFGYYAALVLLDAKVLFSKKKVSDLLSGAHDGKRKAVERHHLFPKGFLKTEYGVKSTSQQNQIANLALVEWDDNSAIAKSSPRDYGPVYAARFSGPELAEMYYWHALPPDWHDLTYDQLLEQRTKLMARVIRDGYLKLAKREARAPDATSVEALLQAGEGPHLEYKSTLRTNLHTNQPDQKIEHAVLKTVTGFLNTEGGTLLIGVDDSGRALGLASDAFLNEDKMTLHLVNLIKDRLGPHNAMFIDSGYAMAGDHRVMVIGCRQATKPVFLKDGGAERFYIRILAATQELQGSHMQHYIEGHFA